MRLVYPAVFLLSFRYYVYVLCKHLLAPNSPPDIRIFFFIGQVCNLTQISNIAFAHPAKGPDPRSCSAADMHEQSYIKVLTQYLQHVRRATASLLLATSLSR